MPDFQLIGTHYEVLKIVCTVLLFIHLIGLEDLVFISAKEEKTEVYTPENKNIEKYA